jgi:hypothetical protein
MNPTSSSFHWLARVADPESDRVENDYESEDFAARLAGKLSDITGGENGPGSYIHYNNVAIAYTHLYGLDIEGVGANASMVTRSGEHDSVAELRIPAAAGMLHKAWNIVVGPELNWSAVATTTDFASEAQAVTARNALTYYWEHEGVGSKAKGIAFEAMGLAECAMHVPWDREAGEDVGVDQSDPSRPRLLRSGDITYRRIPTWDILRDPSAKSHAALDWIIVREWPNKFDVAAQCKTEGQAQAVLTSSAVDAPVQGWAPWRAMRQHVHDFGERIPVYYLYSKRTPSVPAGRQTVFLADGTILEDGPLDEAYVNLPPECIGPVAIMYSDEYRGTPWPYTKFFGVLGAGQAADGLHKDLLTNATSVCGPVVSAEDDQVDSIAPTQIGGGPRIIPRPKGSQPPTVLDLKSAHPDHFKLIGNLRNEQQQILGLDSITAGQDIGANLSGAAMALMTSTSVQNNSQWQSTWTKFVQAIGNITLRHIQKHMTVPKRIALAGDKRASLVTTTDLIGTAVEGIDRVLVSIGGALQQTDAGRYEIATTALKEKWVQTPEQFQEVLDTGRLDALTENLSNQLLLIRSENERIGRGKNPVVSARDDHRLHLKLHGSVMSSLTAREDEAVVLASQAHDDAHIRALRETDPAVLEAYGQQPLMPAMAPGVLPGAGAQPPGGKPPPSPQERAQEAAPSMPRDPRNGEPAKPVAGVAPPQLAVKPGVPNA